MNYTIEKIGNKFYLYYYNLDMSYFDLDEKPYSRHCGGLFGTICNSRETSVRLIINHIRKNNNYLSTVVYKDNLSGKRNIVISKDQCKKYKPKDQRIIKYR